MINRRLKTSKSSENHILPKTRQALWLMTKFEGLDIRNKARKEESRNGQEKN